MPLRSDLKRWGEARAYRYERKDAGPHVLSRAREFAPGTAERALRQLLGRDGRGRRTLMGAAAGRFTKARKPIPVPMWACDPVPSRDDCRGGGFDSPLTPQSVAWVDPMPDELHWIDQALTELARVNLMRMLVLREEFSGHGTQRTKAERVAEEYGGELTVWQYRRELVKALAFLEAKQPA